PPREEFIAAVHRILDTAIFSNAGPFNVAFEGALCKALDVDHCVVFCNGTVALQCALVASEVRGEVITSPFTFPGTVHAIRWIGLTPVFADIEPDSLNLSPRAVAQALSSAVGAIMPVHTFATPCDVRAFDMLAAKTQVPVIYDGAHIFGVRVDGAGLGRSGT